MSKLLAFTHSTYSIERIDNVFCANALTYLVTPTYDDSGVAIHPDVYYNAAGWNGKKYWMGMTPFTDSSPLIENPSILCSDDGDTWTVPVGLTNPLAPSTGGFNADVDLTVTPEGVMWCLWRKQNGDYFDICGMSSTDGVNWTAKEVIIAGDITGARRSPAVVWNGTQYIMFTCTDTVPYIFQRATCPTIDGEWSALATISTPVAMASSSHLDVIRDGNYLWAIVFTWDAVYGYGLWLMLSSDWGLTWIEGSNSFLRASGGTNWDGDNLYRASVVKTNFGFDMWYSAAKSSVYHIGRTKVYL